MVRVVRIVRAAAIILILLLVLYVGYLLGIAEVTGAGWPKRVNSGYATRASLRFHYESKSIDKVITDADDVGALKDILAGWALKEDSPSCGFDMDVSITVTNGRKSITFCPACDGCSQFRIGKTSMYLGVSDAQMKRFRRLVRKYGMTIPCV
jgi:hypothetical protein